MAKYRKDEVSPLTKILIHKAHGGRKQDSKFWQSDFDQDNKSYDVDIPKRELNGLRRKRIFISSAVIIAIISIGYTFVAVKPEFFPFLDRHWLHKNTVKKYSDMVHSSSGDRSDIVIEEASQRPSNPAPVFRTINLDSKTPKAGRGENQYSSQYPTYSASGKVFSWQDKDGKMHFSNTNFPTNNETLKVQTEINTYHKVTKVNIVRNQVYVPVILSNAGKRIKLNMLLDTGCSHTVVPYRELNKLKVNYGRQFTATNANGSKSFGKRAMIDYIKVGSRSKRNFSISGSKVAGSHNTGLLGVDFLKDNPFKIDFENGFIVWM